MRHGLKNILAFWRPPKEVLPFTVLFKKFQSILERNNRILELMADMGDKLGGEYVFDGHYIEEISEILGDLVFKLISDFSILNQHKNADLFLAFERIRLLIQEELSGQHILTTGELVLPLSQLGHELAELAGAKMANLGDIDNRLELSTADGFVITTRAFFEFLQRNNLLVKARQAAGLWQAKDDAALKRLADEMQESILATSLPRNLTTQILAQFDALAQRLQRRDIHVAMRSSAWGEDGSSSFAGQYETVLNVSRDQLLDAYRRVVASAYSYEAWHYRLDKGYHENETAMAVGCQVMVQGLEIGRAHV